MFDTLQEARSVARARALESFEYFANTVLDARLSSAVCTAAQRAVEQKEDLSRVACKNPKDLRRALQAWLTVLGKDIEDPVLPLIRNETFLWLFQEAA